MNLIKLNVEGNVKEYFIDEKSKGIMLKDIAKEVEDNYNGYSTVALVNNKLKELTTEINEDCNIKFLDTNTSDGSRVYTRTLTLIFIMACEELCPGCRVSVERSLSNGLYCEIHGDMKLTEEGTNLIRLKMKEIIEKDYEIKKYVVAKDHAIKFFRDNVMNAKAELLTYKEHDDVKIYKCNSHLDHFYGHMLPSTGHVKTFDIKRYEGGFILLRPKPSNKYEAKEFISQPKLSNIYLEMEKWSNLMGIDTVLSLNKIVERGNYGALIDRKGTRLNSSHRSLYRTSSSA